MTPEEETFITLQEPAPVIDERGDKHWYNEKDEFHRENNLPAFIGIRGVFFWCINGAFHRENDLPAVIWGNGKEEYWENGERHRENGPAVINVDGTEEYWENGKFIR